MFTPSDPVTDPIVLTGKMGTKPNPFCPSQCPSKRSKMTPVSLEVMGTESLGVNGPLGGVRIPHGVNGNEHKRQASLLKFRS